MWVGGVADEAPQAVAFAQCFWLSMRRVVSAKNMKDRIGNKLRMCERAPPPLQRVCVDCHEAQRRGRLLCVLGTGHDCGGCEGRNWSGVDPPLSLQPRLPHGLHCCRSSLCALSAIGLVRGPKGPNPYLRGLGVRAVGSRGLGFAAWSHVALETESGSWRIFLCSMFGAVRGGREGSL